MSVLMNISPMEPEEGNGFIRLSRYPRGTYCDAVLEDVIVVGTTIVGMEHSGDVENATIHPGTLEIRAQQTQRPLTESDTCMRKKDLLDCACRMLLNGVTMGIFFDMNKAVQVLSTVIVQDVRKRRIELFEFYKSESEQLRRVRERHGAVDRWIHETIRTRILGPEDCHICTGGTPEPRDCSSCGGSEPSQIVSY